MALLPGTRLGPYEVIAQIGAGGMGEVYRATDTSLRRSVAIKVLPDSVVGDTERLARFQREAEVLAAFNHPNIAAIYGLERSTATTALVMELVEGTTLADRISQGAVPVDEALSIAKQIADALEAAHEQNIIHRDLKPANIKVRPDGTVKVLDFGLAKAMEPAGAMSASLSMSPTITTPAMTQAGMILGTAAYMSPEQARGKPVDKRADIWAFGAVLFEMLTGKRAFPGEDITDTLAAVVRAEPDWGALPADLPSALRAYLTRCLQKDPRQRVQAIGDVRLALTGAFETAMPQRTTTATSATPRGRLVWMALLASAAVVIVSLAVPTLQHLRETPPPETRTEIVTPVTDQPTSIALSPDGQQIVFVASDEGGSRLWLRFLATTTAQPLAGTEGATDPFWSPDSRAIGFFARGALKRLDVGGGGTPQTLAPVVTGRGGTWNTDGVIVFAPSDGTHLMRVSATGGTAAAVTTLGPQQAAHRFPHFLPDGRRFLFNVRSASNTDTIYLGALDGSAPIRLTLGRQPRSVSAFRVAAVGAGGRARGAAAGCGAGDADRRAGDAGRRGGCRLGGGNGAGGVSDSRRRPPATGVVRPVGHGAGRRRRPRWQRSPTSARVTRRAPRGRDPHGAGQHGPLAPGRRPHEPRHVRCGARLLSLVVARRHANRVSLESGGCL